MAGEETIDAFIFDMDGVVTDTAEAHFAAWKEVFDQFLRKQGQKSGQEIPPFSRDDYLEHVDGIPRHEGIRRFLRSRDIELPEGSGEDEGQDTVRGLGSLKNRRFQVWLERNTVPTFDDARALIEALKRSGIRVGVFSASRNAKRVLESAGVRDLFAAVVDGVDAERLGLPGKPDPAVLVETARQLGSTPRDAVIVEDATLGVRAGAAGGFALVIGVDRHRGRADPHRYNLRANGADLVTDDLRRLLSSDGATLKTADRLPLVWDRIAEVEERIGQMPDLTDEDAFEALSGKGIGIVVRDGNRVTTADYALEDTDDVRRFLSWLAERVRDNTT